MFKRLRASIRDGFARAFPMVDPFMMVGPDPGQCAVSAKVEEKPTEDLAGQGGTLGRAAFAKWSNVDPELQNKIWETMADDIRAFWRQQEDDQAIAAIIAAPDAEMAAQLPSEHEAELRAEVAAAALLARSQAKGLQVIIRDALADSSTVDWYSISEAGVDNLAMLAAKAVAQAPDLAGQGETVAWAWERKDERGVWRPRLSHTAPGEHPWHRNIRPLFAAPAPSRPAEKDRIVKWLEAACERVAKDEVAHPQGSHTRTFYGAQLVAYENVLSLVQNREMIDEDDEDDEDTQPGAVEHHSV